MTTALLLSAALAFPVGTSAQTPTAATVARVLDGDTVEATLTTGQTITVQLIGMDAPETKRRGAAMECGAREASDAMRKLAEGRAVSLVADPAQAAADPDGRSLYYLDREDGVDVAEAMIRRGWAQTFYLQDRIFQRWLNYDAAEEDAFDAESGVWYRCGGNFHRPAAAPVRLVCNRWTEEGNIAYLARRPAECAVWRENWAHYQALTFIKAHWTHWGKAKARARLTLTANMGGRIFARVEAYRLREDCYRQFRVYTRVAVVYVANPSLTPSQQHKRRVFKPDTCTD